MALRSSTPIRGSAFTSTQITKNLLLFPTYGHKSQYRFTSSPNAVTPVTKLTLLLPSSTDFNLGVTILAFWVCLIRLLLIWCKVRNWPAEIFLQCCVLVTWVLCFTSQLARDFSDENHKSRVPWYLSHSKDTNQQFSSRILTDILTQAALQLNVERYLPAM